VTVHIPRTLVSVLVVVVAAAAGALADHLISDNGDTQAALRPAVATAPEAPKPIRLVGDCRKPSERPTEVVFTCADAGVVADHITWNMWGDKLAVGHGAVLAHDCTPDCASSNKYDSYEVVLIASDAKACGPGDRRYTRLSYSRPAGSPYPPDAPGSQRPYLDLKCSA
jgi:hypothetical protein